MGRVVIDSEKCKGCYLCVGVCPKGILKQGNKYNSKGIYPVVFEDEKKACIGCAMCAKRCPDMAIVEVYR